MDQSNNNLGNVTGGSVQTGNPQNIGSQTSLTAPQSALQSQNTGSLNSATVLRLTDQNGKPIITKTTTKTSVQPVSKPVPANHNATIVGVGVLFIAAVFIATWLITSRNDQI